METQAILFHKRCPSERPPGCSPPSSASVAVASSAQGTWQALHHLMYCTRPHKKQINESFESSKAVHEDRPRHAVLRLLSTHAPGSELPTLQGLRCSPSQEGDSRPEASECARGSPPAKPWNRRGSCFGLGTTKLRAELSTGGVYPRFLGSVVKLEGFRISEALAPSLAWLH